MRAGENFFLRKFSTIPLTTFARFARDDYNVGPQVREERLKAYAEKKSKKPALIAKTSVLLDVKPWDDETDMDAMLKCVKTIEKDGLVWGACK
jgi:hypothetical protein